MNALGYRVPLLRWFHGHRRVTMLVFFVVVVMIVNLKQDIRQLEQIILKQDVWILLSSSRGSTDDDDVKKTNQQAQQQDKSMSTQSVREASVHFIPRVNLTREVDHFAATWWQSKHRFLRTLEPKRIGNVEGAVFHAIAPYLKQDELRMTSDWLKFSVEHMSKAWKLTGFEGEQSAPETQAYHMFVDKFLDYVHRTKHMITTQQQQGLAASSFSAMPATIAVIAFMPYDSRRNATRGQLLTTASLAATVMSLIRVECGRVLIVVDHKDWGASSASIMVATQQQLLQQQQQQQQKQQDAAASRRFDLESFFLNSSFSSTSIATAAQAMNQSNPVLSSSLEYKVHRTEVGVVLVDCTESDDTKRGRMRMVPKAALLNLKKALEGTDVTHSRQWLGPTRNHDKGFYNDEWNFTYLTEPDTILHTKPDALPALSQQLVQGKILAPHRLQPLPHARDLPPGDHHNPRVLALPASGNFSTVSRLGANARCCDAGPDHPGWAPQHCGTWWWQCGFDEQNHRNKNNNNTEGDGARDPHSRLSHYGVMDLEEGTQIVSLAGSEHGRRCIPQWAWPAGEEDCP